MLEITQGVPQGSSFGPLLFALYVKDLQNASAFNSTLFADDTVLSISNGSCIELQKFFDAELQKVDEWMRFNKLSLNYSKPFYMLIGPRGKRLHYFTVQIKDNTRSQTNSTKYLKPGVQSDHIINLEKASRSAGIFHIIRHYLNQCFSKWAESPHWGRLWWAGARKSQRGDREEKKHQGETMLHH